MDERAADPRAGQTSAPKKRGAVKTLWKRVRAPLAQSSLVKNMIASLIKLTMHFIRLTNPKVAGQPVFENTVFEREEPAILALWHGQHILLPAFYPSRRPLVAMVSRSADAEINALVVEKFGIETVRGSGGRESARNLDKGGAKALIALKKALVAGKNVCMIADIPHGTPRDAGLGVILLAKLSGRPIYPAALASSRRKVLEKSWDKTTINLPFGRSALIAAQPIFVASDADEAEMERKRLEVTDALNAATAEAYRMVDGTK
jgi:lysophospholipid acyltransferase (LPLAT)-like uncharacterized protein